MNRKGETSSDLLMVYTDDPLLALGACGVLSSQTHFQYATAAPELSALLPLVEEVHPDVILVDLTP